MCVQAQLFSALRRTRLVSEDAPISSMKYSRCGRTDKGVSALGQVGTPVRHWACTWSRRLGSCVHDVCMATYRETSIRDQWAVSPRMVSCCEVEMTSKAEQFVVLCGKPGTASAHADKEEPPLCLFITSICTACLLLLRWWRSCSAPVPGQASPR